MEILPNGVHTGKQNSMNRSRTIEITVETHEIVEIRQTVGGPTKCAVCGAEGSGYGFGQAAEKSDASEIELARLIELGLIHSTGTKGRVLDICGTSLTDATEE